MDDDDDFLYGASAPTVAAAPVALPVTGHSVGPSFHKEEALENGTEVEDGEGEEEEEEEGEEEDDSEDDVEIITEPVVRSMDFRNQTGRGVPLRNASANIAPPTAPAKSNLTTEYTPREREPSGPKAAAAALAAAQAVVPPTAQATAPSALRPPSTETSTAPLPGVEADGQLDTSSLPPVTAPPSAPAINPSAPGMYDGRSIFDVDINNLAEKPWRRPGSDLSDWFNYGFDEISWEAYCFRRREMGEMATNLKVNVVNFAGMQDDQLNNLPPEIRAMVISGAAAAAAGPVGVPPGMMPGPPAMMHPEMMMGMGVGMGVGMPGPPGMPVMNGEMPQPQPMMPGVEAEPNMEFPAVQGGMMPPPVMGAPGQPAMGMDYGMQQDPNLQQSHMFPMGPAAGMDTGAGRGAPQAAFRGRGAIPVRGVRGAFGPRGRGRGGMYDGAAVPPRAASPLPPGVPTGPRNQNRYKDRDGNAPTPTGLDYGGDSGSAPPEEEKAGSGTSRKRRASPAEEGGSRSKRR